MHTDPTRRHIATYSFEYCRSNYAHFKPNPEYCLTYAKLNLAWIATCHYFMNTRLWLPEQFVLIQRLSQRQSLSSERLQKLFLKNNGQHIDLDLVHAFTDAQTLLSDNQFQATRHWVPIESDWLPNIRNINSHLIMHRVRIITTHPVQAALLSFALTNDYLLCIHMLIQAHMPLLLMNHEQNISYQNLRTREIRSLQLDRRLQFLCESVLHHPGFQ